MYEGGQHHFRKLKGAMAKGEQQLEMAHAQEDNTVHSSVDDVATEEEEGSSMDNQAGLDEKKECGPDNETQEEERGAYRSTGRGGDEMAAENREQLTPYVAKCHGHLETLRKRKRQQEEQVESLVEETGMQARMEDEETVARLVAAPDGSTALLVSAPPVEQTTDSQLKALLDDSHHHYFDQWKYKNDESRKSAPTRLRKTLTQLLPTLIGARDYAGAAKVLAVMYHRFAVTPALCVQSQEIRDKLKREDLDDEGEEDEDMDDETDGQFQSIESVIEANYLFKTPIGVHILYQHACGALRRAVSLSPSCAIFVEHYVQLLVLVGDIQTACDYLEDFFHANPDDPHGARMVRKARDYSYLWMKNDPSCGYPLDKIMELSSAGAVSSFVLTKVLVKALDTCGSDLHITRNPSVALALWRNLAELLAAMDEEEFSLAQAEESDEEHTSYQQTLAEIGKQRLWWKRVYFSRPATIEEVTALATDSRDEDTARKSFHEMPFIHIIVGDARTKPSLPAFKGSSNSIHVMDRDAVVKSTEEAKVVVTRTDDTKDVDPQLVAELEAALEGEVFPQNATDLPLLRKRKSGEMFVGELETTLIPAYVDMVEEEAYSNEKVTVRHIHTAVSEKLRLSDMIVPTLSHVRSLTTFFRQRWTRNVCVYGHRGLLLRYEAFLASFVLLQRSKGAFEVSRESIKAAMQEMKRSVASSRSHFPDESIVGLVMRIKMAAFARQRRLRLMEIRQATRAILKQLVFADKKDLVNVTWSVCKRGALDGVVSLEDIVRTVEAVLPGHYDRVVKDIHAKSRKALEDRRIHGKTTNPEVVLKNMKRRWFPTMLTLAQVKAFLWVKAYEATHGRIVVLEAKDDDVFP
ncbi:hypothetical protein BBJ28_00010009 [Nothophytophthora sp. Chile5]|nr:hypothetical protein BBJ28_00010009 [Nothophytophthora sp. Chile5]